MWNEGFPKVYVRLHTPSIAFRHLSPNSARVGYATDGALFPQDTAVTVVANAEVVSESTKEIASNILLSFFIFPPFKRLKN